MESISDLSTQNNNQKRRGINDRWRKRVLQMAIFAMLGTIMFCSKIVMEFLPNVHLLGALTITYTLVFRAKALIPIIYQRCVGGTVRWFQSVVGSIYLHLDSSLGIDDDYAKKDAEMAELYSVSVAVRIARICVRYALCSRTGTDVSS